MVRRRLLLAGGCMALSGCGISPTLDLIADTTKKGFSGKKPGVATRAQIDDIPYSTLGVRVGDSQWALMVLVTAEDGVLRWISHDGVTLVTYGGLIVRTKGMQKDLSITGLYHEDVAKSFQAAATGVPTRLLSRTFSVSPDFGDEVPLDSRLAALGAQSVDLFGERTTLAAYRESLDFPTWRWRSENYYWLDERMAVRKSIQRYCPEVPAITLEFFLRFKQQA